MTQPDDQNDGHSEESAPDSTTSAGASDDMKQKFREALDRKNGKHHATVEAAGGAKINHTQGNASQKREFRRKSG